MLNSFRNQFSAFASTVEFSKTVQSVEEKFSKLPTAEVLNSFWNQFSAFASTATVDIFKIRSLSSSKAKKFFVSFQTLVKFYAAYVITQLQRTERKRRILHQQQQLQSRTSRLRQQLLHWRSRSRVSAANNSTNMSRAAEETTHSATWKQQQQTYTVNKARPRRRLATTPPRSNATAVPGWG